MKKNYVLFNPSTSFISVVSMSVSFHGGSWPLIGLYSNTNKLFSVQYMAAPVLCLSKTFLHNITLHKHNTVKCIVIVH